jgi:hypothetical protein
MLCLQRASLPHEAKFGQNIDVSLHPPQHHPHVNSRLGPTSFLTMARRSPRLRVQHTAHFAPATRTKGSRYSEVGTHKSHRTFSDSETPRKKSHVHVAGLVKRGYNATKSCRMKERSPDLLAQFQRRSSVIMPPFLHATNEL